MKRRSLLIVMLLPLLDRCSKKGNALPRENGVHASALQIRNALGFLRYDIKDLLPDDVKITSSALLNDLADSISLIRKKNTTTNLQLVINATFQFYTIVESISGLPVTAHLILRACKSQLNNLQLLAAVKKENIVVFDYGLSVAKSNDILNAYITFARSLSSYCPEYYNDNSLVSYKSL